jgi:hypothetical protein
MGSAATGHGSAFDETITEDRLERGETGQHSGGGEGGRATAQRDKQPLLADGLDRDASRGDLKALHHQAVGIEGK